MTKESLVALVLVATVGLVSFGTLGRGMSHAIEGESGSETTPGAGLNRLDSAAVPASLSGQAAASRTIEGLVRFARRAGDQRLFEEWVKAVSTTKRQLVALEREWIAADGELHGLPRALVELTLADGFDSPSFRRLREWALDPEIGFQHVILEDLSDFARRQHSLGRDDALEGTLEAIAEIARALPDMPSRQAAQKNVAVLLAEIGRFEDAVDTAIRIRHPMFRRQAIQEIGLVQAEAGMAEDAKKTLRRVRGHSGKQTDAYVDQIVAAYERTGANSARSTRAAPKASAPDTRLLLGRPEFAERIARIRASGDWQAWLPKSANARRTWGSALAEDWEQFAELPADAFGLLVEGALSSSSLAFDDKTLLGIQRLVRQQLRLFEPEALTAHAHTVDVLSKTKSPLLEARQSIRAMGMPEPRPLTRGLLVKPRAGKSVVNDLQGALFGATGRVLDVYPGAVHSVDELTSLFDAAGDGPAIVRIKNVDQFAKTTSRVADGHAGMLEALAHLMDNHPRVMVVGETKDPAAIHPMLRERGRFGPFYQGTAP